MSNESVNIILGLLIFIHLLALVAGAALHKLPAIISLLNFLIGMLVIIYWVQKQLRVEQQIIHLPEMIILGLELLVIAGAAYFVLASQKDHWLKVIHYIIFGIHLALLIIFLIFMLTFKMKRLI